MFSLDRAAAMRYQSPFAFTPDGRERNHYGAHRRSPPNLRDYLAGQGAHLQGARYPLSRDRGDLGNAAGVRGILRGRGDSADLVGDGRGILRGHRGQADIAGEGRGVLRGRGGLPDIAAALQGRGNPAQLAAELRGRGQAAQLSAELRGCGGLTDIAAALLGCGNPAQLAAEPRVRGQAAQLAAELRGREQAAELAAELRHRVIRPRRESCHDHQHSSERQVSWLNELVARHRVAQRPPLHEILAETYAKRQDLDHGHHCDHHHDHDYHQKKRCCGCSDAGSKEKKEYAFKTKDVTLRGKSYQIRKSFLADLGKFENDLIKFVDKKSEEELPESVIQLLIDFINDESCDSDAALDLVGLNILASNLGYRSAVDSSLQQLKKLDGKYLIRIDELAKICGAITMSGKVDEGIESWLKKSLRDEDTFHALESSRQFRVLVANHPEVWTRLQMIMGWRDKDNELGLMVM